MGINEFSTLPTWLEILISILILDLGSTFFTHKIPLLWKLHRLHHLDGDMDVTTAIRFHLFEIALSMGLKILLVYIFEPVVIAVIIFEFILNGPSIFKHTNLVLLKLIDSIPRFIVTPDMHHIHYSVIRIEHDTNYGFVLFF